MAANNNGASMSDSLNYNMNNNTNNNNNNNMRNNLKSAHQMANTVTAAMMMNNTNNKLMNAASLEMPRHVTRKEELQVYYQKCLRGISHSINIIKAVLMRLVFSLHSLFAISYVYLVRRDEWYLVNFIGVVFLLIELFVTIIKRKGKEPRWYFNSILFREFVEKKIITIT